MLPKKKFVLFHFKPPEFSYFFLGLYNNVGTTKAAQSSIICPSLKSMQCKVEMSSPPCLPTANSELI